MILADCHTTLKRVRVVWSGSSAGLEADADAWECLSL